MFDAASEPAAAVQPDPPRPAPDRPASDRPAPDRPLPPEIARVVSLIHTLVAYGKTLADTLQQHAAAPHLLPCFAFVARIFGTADLARILTSIARGLLRAAALEARLRRRAARGRDLMASPPRPPAPRQPRAAKPAPAQPPALDRLPTQEGIAAEIRHRPIGAVIVDICLDLDIVAGQMDRATWDELSLALIGHGGSLANLVFRRERQRRPADPPVAPPADSPTQGAAGHGTSIADMTIVFPEWPTRSPPPPSPMAAGLSPGCTGPP